MENQSYLFTLEPLIYPYNGLEPYIDALTVQIHHDKHLNTYVTNLNNILKNYEEFQSWTLEKLIKDANWLPEEIKVPVKNNAGGVYNHQFYFSNITDIKNTKPSESLLEAINKTFNSFDNFVSEFKKSALSVFGSGYTWLVKDSHGVLKIINTSNQDTVITSDYIPLICIDVWEHSYYLKYQNVRKDYIDNFINIIDFRKASFHFENN